jgi:hypothetical protein
VPPDTALIFEFKGFGGQRELRNIFEEGTFQLSKGGLFQTHRTASYNFDFYGTLKQTTFKQKHGNNKSTIVSHETNAIKQRHRRSSLLLA